MLKVICTASVPLIRLTEINAGPVGWKGVSKLAWIRTVSYITYIHTYCAKIFLAKKGKSHASVCLHSFDNNLVIRIHKLVCSALGCVSCENMKLWKVCKPQERSSRVSRGEPKYREAERSVKAAGMWKSWSKWKVAAGEGLKMENNMRVREMNVCCQYN